MAYDLHITRADDWSDSEKFPITKDEWEAIIAADPELRLDSINGDSFAYWVDRQSGKKRGWFEWSDGEISTRYPDRAQLGKMLQLAQQLGAQVQGDDGEKYTKAEGLTDRYLEVAARGRRQLWMIFCFAMSFFCLSVTFWLLGRYSLILWIFTGLVLVACYWIIQFKS